MRTRSRGWGIFVKQFSKSDQLEFHLYNRSLTKSASFATLVISEEFAMLDGVPMT